MCSLWPFTKNIGHVSSIVLTVTCEKKLQNSSVDVNQNLENTLFKFYLKPIKSETKEWDSEDCHFKEPWIGRILNHPQRPSEDTWCHFISQNELLCNLLVFPINNSTFLPGFDLGTQKALYGVRHDLHRGCPSNMMQINQLGLPFPRWLSSAADWQKTTSTG